MTDHPLMGVTFKQFETIFVALATVCHVSHLTGTCLVHLVTSRHHVIWSVRRTRKPTNDDAFPPTIITVAIRPRSAVLHFPTPVRIRAVTVDPRDRDESRK